MSFVTIVNEDSARTIVVTVFKFDKKTNDSPRVRVHKKYTVQPLDYQSVEVMPDTDVRVEEGELIASERPY